jgi:hypothetical protein
MNRKSSVWGTRATDGVFFIMLLTGLFCSVALQAAGEGTGSSRLLDRVSFDQSAGETPGILKLASAIEAGRGPASLDAERRFIRCAGHGP